MKIVKNFFITCENVIIDEKNRVSLINLYDFIFAQKLPAYHGRLYFVGNVKVIKPTDKINKFSIKITINTPSGKPVIINQPVQNINVNTSWEEQNIGSVFAIDGIVFNEFGDYKASLLINEEEVAHLNIKVIAQKKDDIPVRN